MIKELETGSSSSLDDVREFGDRGGCNVVWEDEGGGGSREVADE